MRILIFGDSITYGCWDKKGGWVARLRSWIDEKNMTDPNLNGEIHNLGIQGETTEYLLKRFDTEAKARVTPEGKTYFIFQIGVNDSCYLYSEKSLLVSPREFRRNLKDLIKATKRFSSEIMFLGLLPVDEEKVIPIPWDEDKSYKNESVGEYNEIITEVCNTEGVQFIEMFERFKNLDYKEFLEDGLHPNSEGHKKIFEIVKEFLIENKFIDLK